MAASADKVPAVFVAMGEVRAAINKIGVAKDKEVTDGARFWFRGIDSVLNTFSGPMAAAGLMIIPAYSDLVVTERKTSAGKSNYNTRVTGSYTLVSTIDGSSFPMGSFYGEANDTQDKSVAKAQSIALRQAYLQTFVVPLGAEMDPEDGDSTGLKDPVDSGKPIERKVQGEVLPRDDDGGQDDGGEIEPLTDAQSRILKQKCKTAGIEVATVAREVGKIGRHNFNEALDFVKKVAASD